MPHEQMQSNMFIHSH